MYPFDANFEGKLFFITMLTGVSFFCYYLIKTYEQTKDDFKKWIMKVKTEILPEQKRQRKEFYKQFMITFYPEYYKMKIKGEIP